MKRGATLPSRLTERAAAQAGGVAPIALLAVATILLGALQVTPRAGLPVMLMFPPRTDADHAVVGILAVPGWDLVSVRRLGPLTIAVAAPAGPDADVATLRRGAGAWLGLNAIGRGGCAGWTTLSPT